MFPQTGQPPTSAMVQQNNSLLGNPQIQANSMAPIAPVLNSTAPASSTTNPQVAGMVKALKGGM